MFKSHSVFFSLFSIYSFQFIHYFFFPFFYFISHLAEIRNVMLALHKNFLYILYIFQTKNIYSRWECKKKKLIIYYIDNFILILLKKKKKYSLYYSSMIGKKYNIIKSFYTDCVLLCVYRVWEHVSWRTCALSRRPVSWELLMPHV